MPLWLEAAVLAAGQGNEVAIVMPEEGRRGVVNPRLAEMGVRIVFCPLKRPWALGSWLGMGRAKRLAWWRGEFPEPPDAVCLAADGVRETLPGCLEWLRERRSGYVEAAEPPRAVPAGIKNQDSTGQDGGTKIADGSKLVPSSATRAALDARRSTLDTQSRELLTAMYRLAARDGVTRYHKWRGLPFLWDEEWI